jgi:hypothetical protein
MDSKNIINKKFCNECGGHTTNDGAACQGAMTQEYHFNESFHGLDTKGMITCNCCDNCRWKCHESFMDSVADGEQETNNPNKYSNCDHDMVSVEYQSQPYGHCIECDSVVVKNSDGNWINP